MQSIQGRTLVALALVWCSVYGKDRSRAGSNKVMQCILISRYKFKKYILSIVHYNISALCTGAFMYRNGGSQHNSVKGLSAIHID